MVRVHLPQHLRTLASISERDIQLEIAAPITQRAILDALETRFPALKGAIRDHGSDRRRPMLRFFACQEDLSHESPDAAVPEAVATGKEPFFIIGAIAGGQLFASRNLPLLTALVPQQNESPFAITQLAVLAVFVVSTGLAMVRYRV